MGLSRRDLFKLGGGAAAVVGLSHFPIFSARASRGLEVEVYAFHCGILKTQTQYILKDTRVGVPFDIPVPFYLIRRGGDWVAYDMGNNAQVAVDPIGYWSQSVCEAYMPVMKPYEAFRIQIKKLGLKPEDLHAVIVSHGHLDHCGALEDFVGTQVPIYIQKKELEWVKAQVESGKRTAYIPDDFKQLGEVNIQQVDGVLDLFGDQSVMAIPTVGHTPGHQSLLVRASSGKNYILAQDACYTLENMFACIPPGLAHDIPDSMTNIYHFKAMSVIGAELVPPHDPDWWAGKPLAPQKLIV
ncbi:N-acyl homoserine lactonase family protein [Desulfogranum japonicum]|uniref:N-acyl homoserine lactonase family protein n=1 Tax=Desulfogranum japonicum TaxID=231447 RepID=UPI00041CB86E|nr:N-acyl homoserine lactonase family protein [Desulfogranum japonicum]